MFEIWKCTCLLIETFAMINGDCLSSFFKYITDEKLYQTIVIYENSSILTVQMNEINQIISSNSPNMKIDDSGTPVEHPFNQLPSVEVGRPLTLFVIYFQTESFVEKILEKLETTLWSAHEQRILMISFFNNTENLLRSAWHHQFVDVTHLQIDIQPMMIHQFNPFISEYAVADCGSKTNWYPNRMKDLHGYPLHVGILHTEPFSMITRNTSGHVISANGSECEVLQIISKSMNFSVEFLPWFNETDFGDIDENDPSNVTGMLAELQRHNIDMIANHLPPVIMLEKDCPVDYSLQLWLGQFCPLVPVLFVSQDIQTLHIILPTIVLIILTMLLLSRLCRFDPEFWTYLNIHSVIIGFSTIGTPGKFFERVIFLGLVTISAVFSLILSREFVRSARMSIIEFEFKHIEDIIKKQLIPMAELNTIPINGSLEVQIDGRYKKVMVEQWESEDKCLNDLAVYKNVSCIIEEFIAKASMFEHNTKSGKPVMRVMKHCIWDARSSMTMRKGSAYTRYINKQIAMIDQSGIHLMLDNQDNKHLMTRAGTADYIKEIKVKMSLNLIMRYCGLVLFIATCSFVVELILGVIFKYAKNK